MEPPSIDETHEIQIFKSPHLPTPLQLNHALKKKRVKKELHKNR